MLIGKEPRNASFKERKTNLADDVHDGIDELSTLSVVSLSPVVSGSALSKDKVVGAEDLSKGSRADGVHGSGLKIDEDSAGNILAWFRAGRKERRETMKKNGCQYRLFGFARDKERKYKETKRKRKEDLKSVLEENKQ